MTRPLKHRTISITEKGHKVLEPETTWVTSKWIVLWRLGPDDRPVYVGPPVREK